MNSPKHEYQSNFSWFTVMDKLLNKSNEDLLKEKIEDAPYDKFINACIQNDIDVVKPYINIETRYIIKGLSNAAVYNSINVFKYLIEECKVPLNELTLNNIFDSANEWGAIDVMKYLIENNMMTDIRCNINRNHIKPMLNINLAPKLLLNINVQNQDLFVYYVEFYTERRVKIIKYTNEVLLDKTELCINVISLICSYAEY